MSVIIAATAAMLCSVGTYMVLQRKLSRVIIGIALLSHGANVLLVTAGRRGSAPLIGTGDPDGFADPLPQALVLTAIVISFGVTALLLALAYRSWLLTHDDEIQDDVEDRALAERGSDDDTELVDVVSLPTLDPEDSSEGEGEGGDATDFGDGIEGDVEHGVLTVERGSPDPDRPEDLPSEHRPEAEAEAEEDER